MIYKIVVKEEVKKDLSKLSKSQRVLVYKQFKKLQTSPQLGKKLGNKAGLNLSGYRKVYVDKKRIRVVYKIIDDKILVEIVAVGKREDMQVYKDATLR